MVGLKRATAKYFKSSSPCDGNCGGRERRVLQQVYQVRGRFARKYHGANGTCFVVYQTPINVNGGGSRCFVGGRLNRNEPPRTGAKREFEEETGIPRARIHDISYTYRDAEFTVEFAEYTLAELGELCTEINGNLASDNYAARIENGIMDDELASVEVVNYDTATNVPYFTRNNRATGWFYNALADGNIRRSLGIEA